MWANVDGSDTWPEEVKTITVQLTADGKDVTGKTATLSADQTSYTFESLPKYKADGETEIVYGVKEVKVAGYESEVGTPVNVEDDGKVIGKKITITNTQEADLLLTKTVDAFFDHAGDGGDAVYPSFAFSVKGYAEIDENGEPVGEPILDTVVGVDFNNFASTKKERLITKLPQGVAVVVVEELDSGNYTSDPKKKTVTELEFDKDTQRYRFKVSFDNNLGENPPPPSYKSGVVNRYEKNSNGNYEHPKNSEHN